ncbi:MAG: glycine/D-amino acid oxidase, deaminating [Bacteroidota bacterium]|nr:glycine/D-amino acid oxidase, deaminating [Bacteroidota bacterium]
MFSFWEKQSVHTYDFAVIGAGIMGCSIAFELRQKFPDAKIVILERSLFPSGASTKNAGFACFGSPSEILHDVELNGENKTIEIVSQRIEGLKILQERLGDEKMGRTSGGGYELIFEDINYKQKIDRLNQLLSPIVKTPAFSDVSDKIDLFGFSGGIKQLLSCCNEAQIDSGKMMMNYWNLLRENNITIITGANIKKVEDDIIEIEGSSNDFLKAKRIFICTNAFIKDILPGINIKPGRGQVLITKPVKNLSFSGSFHFDKGYYYFRNVGDRVLFGGGRNIDFLNEESKELVINQKIIDDLILKLHTVILPGKEFEIDQVWQGIMGFADNKLPHKVNINSYTTYAMSCNGMGIALSPFIARELVFSI